MKSYLLRLLKPLGVISDAQAAFWIFISISIVVGQAGILLSLLCSLSTSNMTFKEIISDNLVSGRFYTFAISLIAARITPFLLEYIGKDEIRFKSIKTIGSVFAVVFLLLPMTGLFARHIGNSQTPPTFLLFDWLQVVFYILSVLICIYLFCVSILHHDYETYAELDRKGVVNLGRQSAARTHDSQGNAL